MSAPTGRVRALERGVTLVELVISITLVSIAAAAVLGVMSMVSRSSVDAMVRHQAMAIATAYLEVALLKSFDDPDGADGETARASLDDVNDFNGLSNVGARDQFDNPLTGLEQYSVAMQVVNGTLGTITTGNALRVDVTVTHPTGVTLMVSGYRTRY